MLLYHLSLPAFLGITVLAGAPTVKLDRATFTGSSDGGTANKFLGIPFAKPPVGPLRFNAPVSVDPYEGSHVANAYGPGCPQPASVPQLPEDGSLPNATLQLATRLFALTAPPETQSEDCLSLNVIAPAEARPGARLPVVVWIYGGGFTAGATSRYDGTVLVNRSIAMGEPVIYVSMNYRLSAFGFLASKEVLQAGLGNFGLQDQRLALRWVQKYISAFGGDPSRVTIWGESAGATSVGLHLLTNDGNTEGLFRGALMQSGSPTHPGPTDLKVAQADYDSMVRDTGCSGASDTLACLREVDLAVLKKAMDAVPSAANPKAHPVTWLPRVDDNFLKATPMELVQRGSVANVPFIIGDCDDEGTLFAATVLNVATDQGFRDYVSSEYFPTAPEADIERLLQLYPSDPAQGSPFDTGNSSAVTPQFKRVAAIDGDFVFHAPRRFLLKHRAAKQRTWSYLSKRFKSVPIAGSAHGSDLLDTYFGGELGDYFIRFINHLDPNGRSDNGSVTWPQYSTTSMQQITFPDDATELVMVAPDTFRFEGLELLQRLSSDYPL